MFVGRWQHDWKPQNLGSVRNFSDPWPLEKNGSSVFIEYENTWERNAFWHLNNFIRFLTRQLQYSPFPTRPQFCRVEQIMLISWSKSFTHWNFGTSSGFVGEFIPVDGFYGAVVRSTKRSAAKFQKFFSGTDRSIVVFSRAAKRSATWHRHDWIPRLQSDLLDCSSSPDRLAPEIRLLLQIHPRSTSTVPEIPSGPSCNLYSPCRRVPRLHRIHSVHRTWVDILRRVGRIYVRDTSGTSLTVQNTVTPRIPHRADWRSKVLHPDKSSTTNGAFLEVRHAYQTLLNPIKRKAYDLFGPFTTQWDFPTEREYLLGGVAWGVLPNYTVTFIALQVWGLFGRESQIKYVSSPLPISLWLF